MENTLKNGCKTLWKQWPEVSDLLISDGVINVVIGELSWKDLKWLTRVVQNRAVYGPIKFEEFATVMIKPVM